MRVLFCIDTVGYADHIALSYLSAIAKELGHSTHLCILDTDSLADKALGVLPHVIAYSANLVGFGRLVAANTEAKRLLHSFVSIMGGPQATFSPETFAESGMDVYCRGEGEYAFADFLLKVERGEPYDDIANLITQAGANPVRPLIKNLDDLPAADRDLVLSNSYLKNTSKKTFYATRGCPFSCAYCSNNYYHRLYKGKGPFVRRFSVERIITEIEDVASKYRMGFVKFGDDCFVLKADAWLEEFAEKYPRRVGVPFNCYLRLDTVSDRMLGLLKKAGCYSVHLSVDSTSQYVREKILRRRMRSENIVGNLRKIRRHGINTWVNYMLAAPESTLQDDLDTIEMSREGNVTYAAYSTTEPTVGTDLYDYCVARRLINPQTFAGDMGGCHDRSALSCFSEKEKDVRYNIHQVGAIIAKLPRLLRKAALALIKAVPPNRVFKKARRAFFEYAIANTIYRLGDGYVY